jgi:molybdenum cofactor guanylyltransferase
MVYSRDLGYSRPMPTEEPAAGAPRPAAVVLAGGRSSRFGSSKPEALFLGRPMLQWVVDALQTVAAEIIVAGPADQALGFTPESGIPLRHVSDPAPYEGPLAGTTAAFETLDASLAFVVSCDTPLLQPATLRLLVDVVGVHEAAIPHIYDRPQPLVALYRVQPVLARFREALARGQRFVFRALPASVIRQVTEAEIAVVDPQLLSFRGINTPEELAVLESEAQRLGISPASPGPHR